MVHIGKDQSRRSGGIARELLLRIRAHDFETRITRMYTHPLQLLLVFVGVDKSIELGTETDGGGGFVRIRVISVS